MSGNQFQRHRVLTRVAVILAVVIIVDLSAGAIVNHRRAHLDEINRGGRVFSDIYHHGLKPRWETPSASWGWRLYSIKTNSLGFRDSMTREVPLSSDRHRILIMGDSFGEGLGVEFEDSFVGRLSLRLASEGIEILNASVVSYSPTIYLAKSRYLLEEVGLKFDEMIVPLDISDAEDEVLYRVNQWLPSSRYPDSTKPLPKRPIIEEIKYQIYLRTVLTYIALNHAKRIWQGKTQADESIDYCLNDWRSLWTVDKNAFQTYGKSGLQLMTEHMNSLHDLLVQQGIKLTLVVYPWPDQIVHHDLDSIQVRHWKAWAREHNVDFINLFPKFIDKRPARQVIHRYFISYDIHWNESGHHLVAEVLLEHLLSRRAGEGNPAGNEAAGTAKSASREGSGR